MHDKKTWLALFWVLVITCGLGVAGAAPAGPGLAAMYDQSELARAADLYRGNLAGVFKEDLIARLTAEERRKLSGTTLKLPLVGANNFPFDYYAQVGTQEVTIPIFSVKFLDDLAITAAWLERSDCEVSLIWQYAAMLARKPPSVFPNTRPPNPRSALGVPGDVLEDHFVDDVSQKILRSAIYFMMAHELGHVRNRHRGYDEITLAQARDQESEADLYALHAMRAISVAPLGMVVLFGTHARFERTRGEFASDEAYRAYLNRYATHPLSPDRLSRIGRFITENAVAFAAGQQDPSRWVRRMEAIGRDVGRVGEFLSDESIRLEFASRASRKSLAEVRASCH